MREILFRGKRIDNGEWIVGHLLRYEDGRARINPSHTDVFCYENDRSTIQTVAHEADAETIGQFTGLTDKSGKNGKKIFEGDLCLCNRNINSFVDNQVFLISFDAEYGQWVGSSSSSNIAADEFSMCEVIGNIHDNPELLKEG